MSFIKRSMLYLALFASFMSVIIFIFLKSPSVQYSYNDLIEEYPSLKGHLKLGINHIANAKYPVKDIVFTEYFSQGKRKALGFNLNEKKYFFMPLNETLLAEQRQKILHLLAKNKNEFKTSYLDNDLKFLIVECDWKINLLFKLTKLLHIDLVMIAIKNQI